MVLIVTTCSSRKVIGPNPRLHAEALPFGSLADVSAEWKTRLEKAEPCLPAQALYRGRGFGLATQAARTANCALRIVSAGLGLIDGDCCIPAYGLTVSPGTSDSILSRIAGPSTAADWWGAIRSGDTLRIDEGHEGLVLMAMSSVYLRMIADELVSTACLKEGRLRIFTRAPTEAVDRSLQRFILPYDERLDGPESPLPGTMTDFAQRALHHFTAAVLPKSQFGSLEEHRQLVDHAQRCWPSPVRKFGQRKPDGEIRALIARHWDYAGGSAVRMHRFLRTEFEVACEQARFRTLFAQVRAELSA